jgi:Outer membrane protein beta-barrel domain
MRPFTRSVIATLALLLPAVHAQNLTLGLVGGGSLTDSFPTQNFPEGPPGGPIGIRFYSSEKDYIVGAMLEYRFTQHWSVEADGLFRTLHQTFAGVEANGSLNSVSPSPVITWEFPVLAKYRFATRKWTPLVELGPSFRTAGNLNGSNPSHAGVTAGFGVELHVGKLTIAPTLRYTRWAEDHAFLDGPKSAPNQVELVAEFSAASASDSHPLGEHLFAGILVGTGLTGGIRTFSESFGPQPPSQSTAPPGGLIIGPMVGLILPMNFTLEINALYRPLGSGTTTWELPVLAKYKFSTHFMRPLIEGGPAFRLPATGAISNHGVTVGGGIELSARFLKIAPEIRFTRWASDTPTLPNQVELLVGFHF